MSGTKKIGSFFFHCIKLVMWRWWMNGQLGICDPYIFFLDFVLLEGCCLKQQPSWLVYNSLGWSLCVDDAYLMETEFLQCSTKFVPFIFFFAVFTLIFSPIETIQFFCFNWWEHVLEDCSDLCSLFECIINW